MATTGTAVQRFLHPSHRQRVAASDEATAAIRELAERQHGVVARWQLIALGLEEGLIQNRMRRGRLLTLHRGVFALGHRHIGLHGQWMAAVFACGPRAVLSHGSAAHLWGIRGSHGPIEVTRISGHRRPHGIRLHQTRSLPPDDMTVEAGIPVTSLERALLDIAGGLGMRQLEHALVAADRSRRLRWPELRRVLDQGGGRKGLGRLRRVAERVDPRAAEAISPTEVDFLALCREADLPLPQVNVLVEGRLVDFFWPKARVIVETDGYAYHSDRPAFERDHETTVALTAAGYRVLRATHHMLQLNPDPFLRLVRKYLRP
jgi:hypothetical protein